MTHIETNSVLNINKDAKVKFFSRHNVLQARDCSVFIITITVLGTSDTMDVLGTSGAWVDPMDPCLCQQPTPEQIRLYAPLPMQYS